MIRLCFVLATSALVAGSALAQIGGHGWPSQPIRPIAMIASTPYVLVLYPGVPAKTVSELVAVARSKPGALNYGSAGPASLAHLAGALFAASSNIQLTHVPYKSSAQSVVDIISGRIE